MSTVEKASYNPAVDLIRTISILSVILIHISTKILEIAKYDLYHYPFTLFFNQASRFAVPLFFLISSFVLELNYPKNFKYLDYLKKRVVRIILPYIFWSAVYYFAIYTSHSHSFFTDLLLGDASYQLYFIPSIFIFYLFFPLLHKYFSFFTNKIILSLLVIIQLLFLSYDYYFHPLPFYYPISVFILNFSMFIFGMLACHYQKDILEYIKKHHHFFFFSLILTSMLITLEGLVLYSQTKNYLTFYSNWRPSTLLYTLIIGSYLFYIFSNLKLDISFIKKIASYSFFVFFVHIIFIEIIYRFFPGPYLMYFYIPFLIVTILSYLSAFILSKIPHLSKITS